MCDCEREDKASNGNNSERAMEAASSGRIGSQFPPQALLFLSTCTLICIYISAILVQLMLIFDNLNWGFRQRWIIMGDHQIALSFSGPFKMILIRY